MAEGLSLHCDMRLLLDAGQRTAFAAEAPAVFRRLIGCLCIHFLCNAPFLRSVGIVDILLAAAVEPRKKYVCHRTG